MAKIFKPETGRALHGAVGVIFGGIGWLKALTVTVLLILLGLSTNALSELVLKEYNDRSLYVLIGSFALLALILAYFQHKLKEAIDAELEVKNCPTKFRAKAIIMALSQPWPKDLERANALFNSCNSINELNEKLNTESILFSWMQNLLGIERHLGDNMLQVALVVSKESLPLVGEFQAICRHFFQDKVTIHTPRSLLGNEVGEACDVNSLSDNFETIKALRKYFHDQKLSGDLVLDITSSTKIYSCV